MCAGRNSGPGIHSGPGVHSGSGMHSCCKSANGRVPHVEQAGSGVPGAACAHVVTKDLGPGRRCVSPQRTVAELDAAHAQRQPARVRPLTMEGVRLHADILEVQLQPRAGGGARLAACAESTKVHQPFRCAEKTPVNLSSVAGQPQALLQPRRLRCRAVMSSSTQDRMDGRTT